MWSRKFGVGRNRTNGYCLAQTSIRHDPGSSGLDEACNAALVVEAARDIQLTGVKPRRSIRFVLFGGENQGMTGPWAYLKGHRNELDRASGAILFEASANHVDGFVLNGRRDIVDGIREALKPIESMGVSHLSFEAPYDPASIDFLLEGIPTVIPVVANAPNIASAGNGSNSLDGVNFEALKRNTAIAAVTAFGIAERAEPIGPRQSRAEIESLLKATGLEDQMKAADLWLLWESGRARAFTLSKAKGCLERSKCPADRCGRSIKHL